VSYDSTDTTSMLVVFSDGENVVLYPNELPSYIEEKEEAGITVVSKTPVV
jgi:hypothetical protein